MWKVSILKPAGAFQGRKTSRMRFCAFSYSMGEPWGRSVQVSMYFIAISLRWFPRQLHPRARRSLWVQEDVQAGNARIVRPSSLLSGDVLRALESTLLVNLHL